MCLLYAVPLEAHAVLAQATSHHQRKGVLWLPTYSRTRSERLSQLPVVEITVCVH